MSLLKLADCLEGQWGAALVRPIGTQWPPWSLRNELATGPRIYEDRYVSRELIYSRG